VWWISVYLGKKFARPWTIQKIKGIFYRAAKMKAELDTLYSF
jgi:hypothetical protein